MALAAHRGMHSEPRRAFEHYAPREQVPLVGYAQVMLTYAALLGAALALAGKRRQRTNPFDLVLLGVGTHKLSRIVTKDFVTAPLRAPFTRREGTEGAGEVHDAPVGRGLRASLGYLLTCPYCTGPWIAMALGTLLELRPLQARFILRILNAVTLSDFLHLAYSRLNESRRTVVAERHRVEAGEPAQALPSHG